MAFVPTTKAEIREWLTRFQAVNDSLDVSRLPTIYAKNARVQFGNTPVMTGLDAIRNYFESTWAKLETMHHEIHNFNMVDNKIYQPCHITWQIKNDPKQENCAVINLPLLIGVTHEILPEATTSTTTSTPPSALTLTSATFAKLSPHPFLLANLQPPPDSSNNNAPSRTNGRQPAQARAPHVNTSSLTHAHGSAVVRTGDTTVICGVRGETLSTAHIPNHRRSSPSTSSTGRSSTSSSKSNELRDYDLLVPNIELATGCAPNFLPGVPPTSLAQTLSTRVYALLHSAGLVDVADLRIYRGGEGPAAVRGGGQIDVDVEKVEEEEEGEDEDATGGRGEAKAYWVLYIDVLFISFDGNPFDAAWAAVVAALRDTKLPRARWDADREMVLCSREAEPVPLNVRGLPVACTAAVFTAKERQKKKGAGRYWVLVDPDRLEESLCDETVTMVVDESEGQTKILGISKSGGTIIGPKLMKDFATVAKARWKEFHSVL
ncbi:ribosomal protein S5 domain 2-type protein [Xylariaceae sp. FL0662B]|nr:ribosomal protein S5 domain 2-type protein [Xylariaceae sp. FL0662B]